jgi:GNAT superfamily N-acetyltransferase
MMEITEARKEDLPEMIALLKLSLGEGLIPKSEEYFIWKHEKNPFGKSKILLAKENGIVVGLRAFMHWRWVSSTESISAVRAVDTATNPDYQGRGIFKKLTLQAVEECKQEGVSFVFNSPNPISKQGYLKMGWHSIGKMPLYFGLGSLIPRLYSENFSDELYNFFNTTSAFAKLNADWKLRPSASIFHTPISIEYLKWRYNDCPIVKYGSIIEPGQFGVVFRLKKINNFFELRICELWTENNNADNLVKKEIKKIIKKVRPLLISCTDSPLYKSIEKTPLGLFGPFKKGPVITLRPLANNNLNNFDEFYKWMPSIGTIELF